MAKLTDATNYRVTSALVGPCLVFLLANCGGGTNFAGPNKKSPAVAPKSTPATANQDAASATPSLPPPAEPTAAATPESPPPAVATDAPYTVTYNGNGNSEGSVPVDPKKYQAGQVITVLSNSGKLAKGGFTFAGWNTQANGAGTSYTTAGATFPIATANVTLYAVWTAVQAFKSCSQQYHVPATANPYLAGVPNGTAITYTTGDQSNPKDVAPDESPTLVTPADPSCLVPGQTISFSVSGSVAHGNAPATDANGNQDDIESHALGGILGKSKITAPLNSLLGVFLGSVDPSTLAIPPALDFTSLAARNYTNLKPQIGQIFFIGTGVNSDGSYRQIVVPPGASRFYMGIMDGYQWNNNVGSLNGGIIVKQ